MESSILQSMQFLIGKNAIYACNRGFVLYVMINNLIETVLSGMDDSFDLWQVQ